MIQGLCKTLLRWAGWTTHITVPYRDKCIICVAPHTSNWDFIIGELVYGAAGRRAGFLMKKEWFFWPLGPMFRKLGGIPVARSKKMSLTDQLVQTAREADYFNLAVTPEGTRSLNTKWRRGFYYIALGAGIPIQLYAIDGKSKRVECTKEIVPTGDVDADMRDIMDYYRAYEGRAIKPGKFQVEPS